MGCLMVDIQEQIQLADWTCTKCRKNLSKERTHFEKKGITPHIIIIGGTCEECNE